jgi:hypothetical protein
MAMRKWMIVGAVLLGAGLAATSAVAPAQPPGRGGKGGKGKDADFAKDQDTFHYLLDHRKEIRRTVTKVEKGVDTLTESDNAAVAGRIVEHAEAMHRRVKDRRPIHLRDPLFAELFRHADKIVMVVEKTPKGVRVKETSDDAYVAKLIQAHADVVSKFIANGHEEVRKNHPVPERGPGETKSSGATAPATKTDPQ